jgi:hypothetical protein
MPNLTRSPFDIKREFVARKAFRTGNRKFTVGQRFPWKRMAVSERRVRQLYEAGWLTYPEEIGPPDKKEVPPLEDHMAE